MDKKEIILSVESKEDKLILQNNKDTKWEFPGGFSSDVAIASLVYGALRFKNEETSCFSNHYKITMTIEILDKN